MLLRLLKFQGAFVQLLTKTSKQLQQQALAIPTKTQHMNRYFQVYRNKNIICANKTMIS